MVALLPLDVLMVENSLDRREHFAGAPRNEHAMYREVKAHPQSYELARLYLGVGRNHV